ncbi:MAG: ABC transporter substrate-binding protein [Pseudomonadota bacterium]
MNIRQAWLVALAFAGVLATLPGQAQTGVTDSDVLIGQFAAQSGPAAELGKRMQAGILAHFKAVNAAGGINGRTLRLVSRDDGYEPERALASAKALIAEDKVFALIGSVGTPTTLAALPAITAEKIPLVGPFSGAEALREPFNRYLFHVRASYYDETERIVQHLTTLGVKKIAVFYQNDSYGKAGLEGVTRALDKRSLKPVASVTVERNSTDVTKAFDELAKAAPEAVVQISAYTSCAALIKLARTKGLATQFFNVSFVGASALAAELGDAGAGVTISQVVPFPFAPSTPIVREYQQRMAEIGVTDYDFSSMEGYLAARVLTEGLRRTGRTLSREGLVASLESLRDFNMGGFSVTYGPQNHQGSRFTELTLISRSGRFVR